MIVALTTSGNYIPPLILCPRKRVNPQLQEDRRGWAIYMCKKTGWSNEKCFTCCWNIIKAEVFELAYDQVANFEKAFPRFQTCDIFPFHHGKFIETDFATSRYSVQRRRRPLKLFKKHNFSRSRTKKVFIDDKGSKKWRKMNSQLVKTKFKESHKKIWRKSR